ncbi:MAG: protein translocase subunit SecD, partial [Pseudomonadota bacterium]|nr:protein translocase subunit SecD [Pseudomonadota bacterium]
MLYFSLTKKILITVFCLFLGLLALPNFISIGTSIPLVPNNTLNLGLDLRGGSYLLLEVDTETIKKEKSEFLLDDIRSNLRKNKIK